VDPLSIRAYARHRKELGLTGGTHRAVQVAIARGRLKSSVSIENGKPKIDPVAADQEWTANTDTLRARGGGDPTKGRPFGSLDGPPKDDARESGDLSVADQARQAQAFRLTYQAKLAELEYRQRVAELIVAADVLFEQTKAARELRDRLRAMRDRLAPLLAAETDPHRVGLLLEGEIDRALAEFVRSLQAA
jgi:hypothetical protein